MYISLKTTGNKKRHRTIVRHFKKEFNIDIGNDFIFHDNVCESKAYKIEYNDMPFILKHLYDKYGYEKDIDYKHYIRDVQWVNEDGDTPQSYRIETGNKYWINRYDIFGGKRYFNVYNKAYIIFNLYDMEFEL